jgi:hypothetical protein
MAFTSSGVAAMIGKSVRQVSTVPSWLLAGSPTVVLTASRASAELAVGAHGPVGCLENRTVVDRLEISHPGVYENYLVDAHWAGGNRVKTTADDVTLRSCEIRNATGNGVGVFGRRITIEN